MYTMITMLAMVTFISGLGTALATSNRSQFCKVIHGTCAQTTRARTATVKMSSHANGVETSTTARNVLGGALELCCTSPRTGFYRDGFCHTDATDRGVHTVCAIMTDEFLEYSRSQGNDLVTGVPQYNFPGLKDGDKWCLCVTRWKEAFDVGKAPRVVLEATHEASLQFVSIEDLRSMAVDG